MRSIIHFVILATMSVLTIGSFPVEAQQANPAYRIVPLAATEGLVRSVNATGTMVGYFQNPLLAVQWQVDAQNVVTSTILDRDLDVGGQTISFDSAAGDISNTGIIAGVLGDYTASYDWRPVVWMDAASQAMELPMPVMFDLMGGEAFAVTDMNYTCLRAVVVGRYMEVVGGSTMTHVAAWAIRTDGTISLPLILDTGVDDPFETAAIDINASLAVVGTLDQKAMRWQLAWNGTNLTVASRLSLFPNADSSNTTAINDSGDICGLKSGKAYLLENVNGKLTQRKLALLVNNNNAKTANVRASALDNSSTPRVVGAVDVIRRGIVQRSNAPVLWQGTTVLDLQKSITPTTLVPSYMSSINNAGWIGGQAWTGSMNVPVVLIPR